MLLYVTNMRRGKAHSELVQEMLHAALVLGDEAVHARQVRLVRAELEQVAQMHQNIRYQLQGALRVFTWSLCIKENLLHVLVLRKTKKTEV